MDTTAILSFVYQIHHKVDGLVYWGRSANAAMEDHAGRLDGLRIGALARIRDEMREEVEGVRAELLRVTDDTKKVMNLVEENDKMLKGIVSSAMETVVGKIDAETESIIGGKVG